jgi:TetR/AcrR family transcriptional repressor of nem operon
MCLCGTLAAGYATLTKPVKAAVTRVFDANEAWLVKVLDQGRNNQGVQVLSPSIDAARLIVATLQGAVTLARPHGDIERFERIGRHLLVDIVGKPRARPRELAD